MQRQHVTVKRFHQEHDAAFEKRLNAGRAGLGRIIRVPVAGAKLPRLDGLFNSIERAAVSRVQNLVRRLKRRGIYRGPEFNL